MSRFDYQLKKIILLFFPISLILGSAFVNLVLIISSIYLIKLLYEKNINIFQYNWINIFYLFFIYIVIISFFSIDFINSFRNSISQFRFIFFSLLLMSIDFDKIGKLFINVISFLILMLCIDVNFQFITGYDIFGYPAEGYGNQNYPMFSHWTNPNIFLGRLSGPFGTELIPGAFIASLSPPLIFYTIKKIQLSNYKKKILKIFFIILIFETVFITGERLSLILVFSSIIVALFFLISFKKFLALILLAIFFLFSVFNYTGNSFLKKRWVETFNISKNISESSYGRIYSSSYKIWQNNFLTGVGLKNYRVQCPKLIDPDPDSKHPFCSPTHSHNFYLEILSETGLIGFLLLMIFYILMIIHFGKLFYKSSKSIYLSFALGSFYYLVFKLIPLPSGSFFSTWNASFFWFHLGLCLSFFNKKQN